MGWIRTDRQAVNLPYMSMNHPSFKVRLVLLTQNKDVNQEKSKILRGGRSNGPNSLGKYTRYIMQYFQENQRQNNEQP